MVLLDQTEFLQECVVPLLNGMILRDVAAGCFFNSVASILIRLYNIPSAISTVGGSKIQHAVHFQILRLALQLRSLLETGGADQTSGHSLGQQNQGRAVGKIGGERMEYVSRICELSVMRLASFVNSGSDIDLSGRAKLEDSVRSLLGAGDANDWESNLVLTPLISACRQRLGAAVELPELPYEIRTLCSDQLKVFSYNKSDFSAAEESNVAKALLLSLSAGRMCDEAIQDITQALRVDWSLAHLDLVLYSFLMICKMSFSVSASAGNSGDLYQRTLVAQDPRAEESRTRQMVTVKSKARDELVLMAMKISEEIIRRADAYHRSQGEITSAGGSKSGVTLGFDREYQVSAQVVRGKRRGLGQEDFPRSGSPGHKEDKAGYDYPSPTSPNSSALLTNDGMDGGTPPLPSSILAPALVQPVTEISLTVAPQVVSEKDASVATNEAMMPLEEVAVESSAVVSQDMSVANDPSPLTVLSTAAQDERLSPVALENSFSVKDEASAPGSTKPLLAPYQVDCLMLGLELLPEQEQQAVKARLRYVLRA
ncbi:hypothetical protein BGZ75_009443 [Mortierella antarctica]|nr:hypothetical protein BGZ75_009443 [Mortierella antarctica]